MKRPIPFTEDRVFVTAHAVERARDRIPALSSKSYEAVARILCAVAFNAPIGGTGAEPGDVVLSGEIHNPGGLPSTPIHLIVRCTDPQSHQWAVLSVIDQRLFETNYTVTRNPFKSVRPETTNGWIHGSTVPATPGSYLAYWTSDYGICLSDGKNWAGTPPVWWRKLPLPPELKTPSVQKA